MWRLVRRRLFDAAIVVWLVGTLSFVLLHLAPGDPVSAVLTDARVAPAVRAQWRTDNALDQPIATQYVRYVAALGQGHFGFSFSQYRPVADALRETLPYSLLLMGAALAGSILLGTAVGVLQATRAGSPADRRIAVAIGAVSAIPEAWLALLVLGLFAAELALFPLSGRCNPARCGSAHGWRAVVDMVYHAALPVLTLMLLYAPIFARVARSALRGVLHDDVMRTATAKGVGAHRALVQHGMRRAARPLLNTIALSLPLLVGGTIFVERVFGWPGMGSLLVSAIGIRDYPLVTATALVGTLVVVAGSTLADAANAWLDPRASSAAP